MNTHTKEDSMTNVLAELTGKVVEVPNKKGCYYVWVSGPHQPGYLRQGFAWKSKAGAMKALLRHMETYNLRGYMGLARNENDSEIA